jgi:hypothetical protein
MRKLFVSAGALVLIMGIGVQLFFEREMLPGKGRHLARVLPMNLAGWSGQDAPLGANEAIQGAVQKTLQFDDIYFREFQSPQGVVSLYVAYWGPGKMPTQLVASHTPDRCWVENGWTCEQAKHQISLSGGDIALRPGEWRLFAAPNTQRLNVQFWHLVGDETYDYGERLNRMPSVWRWWRDAARQIFKAPAEQYFIRLTSDRPFSELREDPAFVALVRSLGQLGLQDRAAGSGK